MAKKRLIISGSEGITVCFPVSIGACAAFLSNQKVSLEDGSCDQWLRSSSHVLPIVVETIIVIQIQ